MRNIHTWEDDGFYGLSYTPQQIYGDDIGAGAVHRLVRFNSEEGRMLFISHTQDMEYASQHVANLESELRHIKSLFSKYLKCVSESDGVTYSDTAYFDAEDDECMPWFTDEEREELRKLKDS